MAIGDFVSKARGALRGNEDKAAAALGKAAGVVKGRTGPAQDRQVDAAVRKAEELLEAEKRHGSGRRRGRCRPGQCRLAVRPVLPGRRAGHRSPEPDPGPLLATPPSLATPPPCRPTARWTTSSPARVGWSSPAGAGSSG